jgi:hypothetical protein
MKNLKTTLFLCICVLNGYAQNNFVCSEIQQAKISGEMFEHVSVLSSVERADVLQNNTGIQEQFINPQNVYFFQYNQSAIRDFNASMTLRIPLGHKNLQLELRKIEMDYVVTTSCGQTLSPNKNIHHYQGIVKDDSNSIVAITFAGNEIIGLVATDEGNFNLAFDEQLGMHIFYNDKNLTQAPEFICNTEPDENFPAGADL